MIQRDPARIQFSQQDERRTQNVYVPGSGLRVLLVIDTFMVTSPDRCVELSARPAIKT